MGRRYRRLEGRVNVERRVEMHGQIAHDRFRCLECGVDLGRGNRNKAGRHAKAFHRELGHAHIVEPLPDAQREALIASRLEEKRAKGRVKWHRWTAKRRQVSQGGERGNVVGR